MNASQLCHWQYPHKETFLQTFLSEVHFLMENGHFAFLSSFFLYWTYAVRLRLIGKRIVDLLVIIELLSLGVMSEVLQANTDWKSAFLQEWGPVWPKISCRRGRPHKPFFLSQNWNDCRVLWHKNFCRHFFCFETIMHLTDRQTDRDGVILANPAQYAVQVKCEKFTSRKKKCRNQNTQFNQPN